jgi:hypothetical protein
MINTNLLTGSWVVREYHVTAGEVTRVCFDAFPSMVEALNDAKERQDRLMKAGATFEYMHDGVLFTQPDFPDDYIVIGVTTRNIERMI